jgi:uncharacterized protein
VDDEVMVVRIYLRETEHGKHKTLLEEVLNILHDQQRVRGVTVFRGIAGFGESGEVHAADMLRLNVDLPLVIEFFDTPSVAQAALALLDGLVPVGHILCWRAVQHQGAVPAGPAGS